MDRRRFILDLAGAAAAIALAPSLGSGAMRLARRARPNILLIMSDDLGYGDLGITGRTDYRTPVIDQIARSGVELTQMYTAAPVCTPTRVALITGRYPARTTAGLYEPLTRQNVGVETDPPTLGLLMKAAGYETALVGKWHLGTFPRFHPLRHGWDEFYGFLGAGADYASHVDVELRRSLFQDGTRTVRTPGYLTDLFTERAVRILRRRRSRPLFLNLQYNAPHWPWQGPGDPPYPDSASFSSGGSPATYGRMVESMDTGVGRVLEALHRAGMERDTLVIFTSDNGGERFSHMGPFSAGKMTLNEGGIRVAAMARWPGVIPAGSRTGQVAVTMDLTATFLALAGTRAPAAAPPDGIDLTPALTGARGGVRRELVWRISQRRRQKAVRSGDWKYLQKDDGEFLYDLATDPGEKTDLKLAQPAVFGDLKERLAAWEREVLPPVPLDPAEA
ncbi:sulfatase-like hydrolase/transferase [Longimicrobium sp.]|uniref:sulfatase-like hydrolase/transferase n=1 Tax=Longimicrobium sp. TaxID=2029185 RepID=UPI002BC57FCF|nr:sulfatase-like hydrolase/transferase [Longimicrobium sp.]HSU17538.1 sulfatase-like hydrolase/transferase [Longimicrobium sp.]